MCDESKLVVMRHSPARFGGSAMFVFSSSGTFCKPGPNLNLEVLQRFRFRFVKMLDRSSNWTMASLVVTGGGGY